jgi:protein-S-isoprenylcysteine O-methyltransferase Ste14
VFHGGDAPPIGQGATMAQHTEPVIPEHSDVIVFPPVIPLSGFLIGVVLQWLVPADAWIPGPARIAARVLGALLLGIGAAGFAWMVLTMKQARTPIHNAKTPTTLVERGPFRWTRNPMYLFGSTAYAGLAMVLIEPWSLAMLPIVLALIHYGVVLREEAFLDRRFGEAYLRYKARVPRWLLR